MFNFFLNCIQITPRVSRIRFQNPTCFAFSESGRFCSNRILKPVYYCSSTHPPRPPRSPPPPHPRNPPPARRPPPPRPPLPWSPPPRPPCLGTAAAAAPAAPASAPQIQTRIFLYGSDSGKNSTRTENDRYRFPKKSCKVRNVQLARSENCT
jgi:hypothetical protein